MATAVVEEEEELLILTDDDTNTDLLEELESTVGLGTIDDGVITFWEEDWDALELSSSPDSRSSVITEEIKIDWEELDLNFNLWTADEEVTVEDMLGKEEILEKQEIKQEVKQEIITKQEVIEEEATKEEKKEELIAVQDEPFKVEEKKEEAISEIEDTWFNFDLEEDTKEEKQEIQEEEKDESDDMSFNLWWDDAIEDTIKEEETIDLGENSFNDGADYDTNTIIDGTIAKFLSRDEKVAEFMTEKSQMISDVQTQIKELQADVRGYKKELTTLEWESKKIKENIEDLKKMKI